MNDAKKVTPSVRAAKAASSVRPRALRLPPGAWLGILAVIAALALPVRAATFVVTNTNDSGAGSLRAAIASANAAPGADVISFSLAGCPCTIVPASTLAITDALTINGPGMTSLALNGANTVQVLTTTGVPVSISDVTIRNGKSAGTGGGVSAAGDLTLTRVTVQGNTAATYGGGVYAGGKITVVDSVFANNTATAYDGGGLYASGQLTVSGSQFLYNTTPTKKGYGGGGGLIAFSHTSISNTVFSSNTAADWGGGAYIADFTPAPATLLTNVQFLNNNADNGGGGGVFSWYGTTLAGVVASDNYAGYRGGGVYAGYAGNYPVMVNGGQLLRNSATGGGGLYSDSDFSLDGTLVDSNTARNGNGGGMWTPTSAVVSNATVSHNTVLAGGDGGGIDAGTTLVLTNSTVSNNQTVTGSGGGISATDANVSLALFQQNTSTGNGGALAANGVTVSRSRFIANTGASGGAVFQIAGGGAITNTLFARNHAVGLAGEALALTTSSTSLKHVTIGNGASQAGGSALYVSGGTVDVLNSIVASHAQGIVAAAGTVNADYNLFSGNGVNVQGAGVTNGHPVGGNPDFVDPASDNYRVGPGSAAINAGPSVGVFVDFDGNLRPIGPAFDLGYSESEASVARLLVPDGTSVKQSFGPYPDTKWFLLGVEPGKTYVIDAVDPSGDLTANAIGTLNVFAADDISAPPEASVDCTVANGPRPPAVDVASDGIRCVLRTALPTAGMQQNKRPVYVKVTRFDPALGGGSQFRIRAREATIYGRWLTAGYDYHVEVENTTADAMCVEVARYPASGLTYTAGPGWSGSIDPFTMTVPAFGAVKHVFASGSLVGADSEGALRISACASPVNLIPGALHVSTFAFDTMASRFVYFFTTTANEGKTRSTW